MNVGPHSDCNVAVKVDDDINAGSFTLPRTDTVTEGGRTITFSCSSIGQDTAGNNVVECSSATDSLDWFEVEQK